MNPYHKQASTFTKSIIIVFSSCVVSTPAISHYVYKWVSASSYSSLVCQNNNLLAISLSCLILYHPWCPLNVTFCRLLYIQSRCVAFLDRITCHPEHSCVTRIQLIFSGIFSQSTVLHRGQRNRRTRVSTFKIRPCVTSRLRVETE